MTLSFVIPIHNEEKTLPKLLHNVFSAKLGVDKELVLIDDGSTDSTPEIIKRYSNKQGVKAIRNEVNLGKSQSVRKGILETTGELVVIQDADLEYDPKELDAFIRLFEKGEVDVVYGNRFGKKNKVIYWQNWVGNTLLSGISALFTGLRARMWTRDMEVCYKMADGEVFRELAEKITSKSSFGLEPEMTALFSKYRKDGKPLRFAQIPITYLPRTMAEGKHISATKDGIKAIWEIIKFNVFFDYPHWKTGRLIAVILLEALILAVLFFQLSQLALSV